MSMMMVMMIHMLYLVGRLSHELFGLLVPDRRDGDDPANVVVIDRRSALVAEFSQRVILEELQRQRDHSERRKALPVRRLYLSVLRTVLHR